MARDKINITLKVGQQYFVNFLNIRNYLNLADIEYYFNNHDSTKLPNLYSDSIFRKNLLPGSWGTGVDQDMGTEIPVGIKIIRKYPVRLYKNGNPIDMEWFDIRLTNPSFKKEYREKRVVQGLTAKLLGELFSDNFREINFIIEE